MKNHQNQKEAERKAQPEQLKLQLRKGEEERPNQ